MSHPVPLIEPPQVELYAVCCISFCLLQCSRRPRCRWRERTVVALDVCDTFLDWQEVCEFEHWKRFELRNLLVSTPSPTRTRPDTRSCSPELPKQLSTICMRLAFASLLTVERMQMIIWFHLESCRRKCHFQELLEIELHYTTWSRRISRNTINRVMHWTL